MLINTVYGAVELWIVINLTSSFDSAVDDPTINTFDLDFSLFE
jgi:uncharacterized membrane protein